MRSGESDSRKGVKMLFCEKCNAMTAEKQCPACGNTALREVRGEDFCFFVLLHGISFTMLESALKQEGVDVVGVPCYTHGVTYATAGRADSRKVYVRYRDWEKAQEVYEALFGSEN